MKDNVHYYLRADDIEKVKDHKDNVNLYFVYKRAYKNKAFKIKLKNNKSFSHILKLFEKDKNLIEKEKIDQHEFLRNKLQNDTIEVITKIQEKTDEERIPYTNKDKYEQMAKENPKLQNLKEKLGLDLDF